MHFSVVTKLNPLALKILNQVNSKGSSSIRYRTMGKSADMVFRDPVFLSTNTAWTSHCPHDSDGFCWPGMYVPCGDEQLWIGDLGNRDSDKMAVDLFFFDHSGVEHEFEAHHVKYIRK